MQTSLTLISNGEKDMKRQIIEWSEVFRNQLTEFPDKK